MPLSDAGLVEGLLAWFAGHRRDLPWRRTYDPYSVWISEIMLQQTQMERGVSHYERWMKRFPDVRSVAMADEEEILQYWEGLGYYRRARLLHAASRQMMVHHGGRVPDDRTSLEALPGLGGYTVAAVLGIAFNQDVVCIDANVERIFSRLLDIGEPVKSAPAARAIRSAAEAMLPSGRAREYDQALMELGALVCAKKPACGLCPLAEGCLARKHGTAAERPVKRPLLSRIDVMTVHAVFIKKGRTLLARRPEGGLWAGMWEFPGLEVGKCLEPAEVLGEFLSGKNVPAKLGLLEIVAGNYTNHRLSAVFMRADLRSGTTLDDAARLLGPDVGPVEIGELGRRAMPSHHRKFCDHCFNPRRPRSSGGHSGGQES